MRLLALDSAATLVITLVAVAAYMGVLWIALAFYVVRDARRRSHSIAFFALALLLAFVPPFLGALIYMVVRPPRTLDEERALHLEEEAFRVTPEEDVRTRPCPSCGKDIEHDFVLCPYCRTQFARRCQKCERSLRLGWPVCPYCAAEVGTHTVPARQSRTAQS